MKNLWVIITTINKPTLAIKKFDELSQVFNFNLLLIGDTKTPNEFAELSATYLSISEQDRLFPKLSMLVPKKHYSRKNIGYVYAMSKGAEYIFDTDDDNIPLDNFYSQLISAQAKTLLSSDSNHCNIYSYFTQKKVWPRGLPLDEIRYGEYGEKNIADYRSPIIQFLANREPDVDAVYRLVDNQPVYFDDKKQGFALDAKTWCPFNSQATLFEKKYFNNLYLPCYVPFRMTDIWRSFVAQIALWNNDEKLSFHQPIVEQFRNEHDFMLDFIDEIEGYKYNKDICLTLEQLLYDNKNQIIGLKDAYNAIKKYGIIENREFEIIDEWSTVIAEYI
jgi:hypothetical protein